jgi:hypothetical protein
MCIVKIYNLLILVLILFVQVCTPENNLATILLPLFFELPCSMTEIANWIEMDVELHLIGFT